MHAHILIRIHIICKKKVLLCGLSFDDFNFEIVNFQFLAMSIDVPLMVYIRFGRASSHVTDFNNRNKFLTAKLLKQCYRYHKLRKAFSKFYRRHFELIEKYHVSLKKLMQQGISNTEFYGDLVYKFKKIIGSPNFSDLFKRICKPFQESRVYLRHYAADCLPSF